MKHHSAMVNRHPRIVLLSLVLILIVNLFMPAGMERAYAMEAPNPTSPSYGTVTTIDNYPPLGIPKVVWDPAPGATKYRVQFSMNQSFSPIALEVTTTSTSYVPQTVSNTQFIDGDWYWRVRVENPFPVSDYSQIMHFKKTWATDNNKPALVAPAHEAVLDFFEGTTFSWQPVQGAASYRFLIAASENGFNTPVYSLASTVATAHQPKDKLENKEYYWQVIPLDPGGNYGTASAIRKFTVGYGSPSAFPDLIPQPIEPANGSNPLFTPTFRWTAVKGAQYYYFQYTSDPSCNFSLAGTVSVTTRNTTYTPTAALPNDVNYCWHVRAHSGASISEYSDWSGTWTFQKDWDIQPELLTPTNGHQYVRYPFFSWTPVPGAKQYKVEVSPANSFPPVTGGWTEKVSNPFHNKPDRAISGTWWWKVTPIDFSGNEGNPSEVSSFRAIQGDPYFWPTPQPIFPLYYYTPRTDVNPVEDRSVPLPVFTWHRVQVGAYQSEPAGYLIQVDDISNFSSVNWSAYTQNLSASPTSENPFNPVNPSGIYYWRVCAVDSTAGGNCLVDPDNMQPMWSQVWKTKLDPTKGLAPTPGVNPTLLRPVNASEWVEEVPLLEWWPVVNATQYEVQISTHPLFAAGHTTDTRLVQIPVYTPGTRMSYYPGTDFNLPFGTYYWRVRAYINGVPQASWSDTWRFQIAAQSRWAYSRNPGDANNRHVFAQDPVDAAAGFDLTALTAAQSATHWHFGFPASGFAPNVDYVLYLDLDHTDGSGGTTDQKNYNVNTISAHRPEYAVYIPLGSTQFAMTPQDITITRWTGSGWQTPSTLIDVGGDIFPSALYAVAVNSTTDALTSGKNGHIYNWNGSSWQQTPTISSALIAGMAADSTAGERWAVGANGTILRWRYGDPGWVTVSSGTSNRLNGVEIVSSSVSYIAGTNRIILRWNGTSWAKEPFVDLAYPYVMNSISMVKPDGVDGWAVGADGKILRRQYVTSSYRWQEATSPVTTRLNGVATTSASTGWAVGDNGVILRRVDSTWSIHTSPTTQHLYALSMISDTDGWAVGANGTMLRLTGTTWSTYSGPTGNHLYSIDMLDASYGWMVGDKGTNYYWNGVSWNVGLYPIGGFIEVAIPSTSIGMEAKTGSAAVSLFSVNTTTRNVIDVIPGGGTSTLDRFASVSEKMSVAQPLTNLTGDPLKYPSILPFFWHWPEETPWEGYRVEVSRDVSFNTVPYSYELVASAAYLASALHVPTYDFIGDNTYFLRVRPQYYYQPANIGGAWSEPVRFERLAYTPQNLQESVTFATPTFTWDIVDGAEGYDLQVSVFSDFGTRIIEVTTGNTSYTPVNTLKNGTYYWRVLARRNSGIKGGWSATRSFTLNTPTPSGLTPNSTLPASVARNTPTLCWQPVIEYDEGVAVLAAWKYRVQVSTTLGFSTVYDTVDTEQTCWTPTKGYADGMYYWRVAMIDGNAQLGAYSEPAQFVKQYYITTLLAPLVGSILTGEPTFMWTPVFPAAKYKLETSEYATFSPALDSLTTSSTSYVPTKLYPNGKTIYWRVAVVDKDNNMGPYTGASVIIDPDGSYNKLYLPFVRR